MKYISPAIAKTKGIFKKSLIPYAKAHKITTTIIALVVVFGGYKAIAALTSTAGETQYVLSRVTRGDIETTIAGTGQVAATNQIDLKAKVSGDISYISAKAGQTMKAGQLIAQIDTTDIAISLKSARLSLQKLTRGADQSTLIQSQNSVADAEQSKTKAEADVLKAYEDAKISLATAYIEVPDVVAGMYSLFYDSTGFLNDKTSAIYRSSAGRTYRDDAGALFDSASRDIKDAQNTFRTYTQTTDQDKIEELLDTAYKNTSELANSLKKTKLAIDFIKGFINAGEDSTSATTAQTNVSSWTSKINGRLNDLLAAKSAIQTAKNSVTSAVRSINERKQSLNETVSGTDELDIESQRLNVQQKEIEYGKYFIRAPFDGVLASLNVKKGDAASGVTIGTFITQQKIAEITLNEIDAANVVVGQSATLTFDAVEDLTATGTVANIDLVGTVTQGVVNYTAQIAFDVQDPRIKPGMSVSATIITSSKKDVLVVPSAAVKTRGQSSYVEVAVLSGNGNMNASSTFTRRNATTSSSTRPVANRTMQMQTPVSLPTPPTQTTITTGLTNNTQTEILTGLTEGQFVVSKTVVGSSTTKTAPTGSLLNIGGGNRATGGATRTGGFQPR